MMNELKSIVKKDISIEKAELLSYSSDASQIHGKAKAVVWPHDKEQVQKIVRITKKYAKTGSNIVPRGAGTGLAGAVVPKDSIVLDFSRMNNILKLDINKKHVIVEPGVVLNDLNNYLKQFNLFFPVVPASHKVCTIGGMISTNAAGERAVKYGKMEGWVAELEVIDGKGNIHVLNKPEKINMFCGTEGILGIITKVKLLVTEPIRNRSMTLLKFDKISNLIGSVKKHQLEDDFTAVEFFDKLSAKLAGLEERYHLFIEFESNRGDISSEEEILKIWNLREGMGPVLSSEGYLVMEDPQIPLENMENFIEWLEKNKIPSFGHIGLGIIHPRFKESQKKLINKMFVIVENLNGRVSGEHGIGLTKKKFLKSDFIEKMKGLKKEYDPSNILNKGKIL